MIINLLHNRIVKETVTEAFEKSLNDSLIPKLAELYGDALEGIQMYEDYLNDNFNKDGYWYYPLTVLISGINTVIWIKWDVSNTAEFENGIPYSYVGEGIDFIIAEDTPIAFKNAIEGRANYFEGGYVKVNVTTDAPSYTILSGKYSQTFIDEMTRQITRVIEKACGVEGLDGSSIEIDMAFAPNTYMEHTSENVTYRRLLISAKGCTARDFWIKWKRLNSSVAFSVNDNVNEGEIVFELGEDVSQKIREKEYRFLVYGNSDKYRVAMGRKNITEWRELIKRAVKRGELIKPDRDNSAHISEVADKLSEILEKCGISISASTETDLRGTVDEANEALRLAVGLDADEVEADELPEAPCEAEAEAEVPAQNSPEPELEVRADEADEDGADDVGEAEAEADFRFGGLDISEAVAEEEGFDLDGEHEQTEIELEGYGEFEESGDADAADAEEETDGEGIDVADEDAEYEGEDSVTAEEACEEAPECIDNSAREVTETVAIPETFTAKPTQRMSDEDAFLAALVNAGSDDDHEQVADAVAIPNTAFATSQTYDSERVEIPNTDTSLERSNLELKVAIAEMKQKEAETNAEKARAEADRLRSKNDELRDALDAERQKSTELRVEIEKYKFAREQTAKLTDDAERARMVAEAEAARIRAEFEELKRRNEELAEVARMAEAARLEAEENSRLCEAKLEEQIELFEKEKIRQKNLVAEAARQAKEELEKSAAEQAEAEADLAAESARLDAIRAETERVRREAELAEQRANLEAEALRRLNERTQPQKSLREIAEEARLAMEERARKLAEARVASMLEDFVEPVIVAEDELQSELAECEQESCGMPEAMPESEAVQEPSAEVEAAAEAVSEVEAIPAPVAEEEPIYAPSPKYTYTAKLVRILFKNVVDQNITGTLHELINEALKTYGFEKLYMEVKAGVVDRNTAVLNFIKYPDEEYDLLIDIIKYIGNAGLGIYKIILE